MSKPKFVYVTYIATTPEKLWPALTSAEFTEKYWFGSRIQSDWKVGSPLTIFTGVAEKDWQGKVLQFDPPRVLSYDFRVAGGAAHVSRVTFTLEPNGGVVKLTLVHDELDPNDEKFLSGISGGWPAVLSNLKSLLEGGSVLVPRPC
ncbi:SRPBCC family protein [Anatilimnocola floriformis]|uniref:SRPBCC family protein n=1 Tax=Anatilimnocola floriformis TaxID=2948575 RepID=UPI0020C1BCE2|nr:SRPBCC family protein [Anatilimnocola floriformis]